MTQLYFGAVIELGEGNTFVLSLKVPVNVVVPGDYQILIAPALAEKGVRYIPEGSGLRFPGEESVFALVIVEPDLRLVRVIIPDQGDILAAGTRMKANYTSDQLLELLGMVPENSQLDLLIKSLEKVDPRPLLIFIGTLQESLAGIDFPAAIRDLAGVLERYRAEIAAGAAEG